ncbi:hypothetical protein [Halogranum rubrum]|uniref:PGF-CTERM sorting domain-containing protein n=1 Tax=Halogranum salarium B-1 TaxID=1210908 RepID=J3JHB9_9EURY|nr:hypothetical protein [Halogranum salarium]EJN60851.1 hypothetical protein HSB1_14540 [Halogranum salarium B-1]
MDNRLPAAAILALLVLLSGCATMTVESDVATDGTIDRYELNLNTSTTVYGLLNQGAEDEGYDSLAEQLRANVNASNAENVSVSQSLDGDQATVTLVVTGWTPVDAERLNVTRVDGRVVYEDTTFYDADVAPGGGVDAADFELRYVVNMPGDVQRAEGASSVNGSTAVYEASGRDAFTSTRVYVESDAPTGVLTPGFGVVPAVVAVLLVVVSVAGVAVARRR